MKRFILLLALLISGFIGLSWLSGCSGSRARDAKPDLVVVAFELTGPVTVDKENRSTVPVKVIVKNRGAGEAGRFKVAVVYMDPSGTHAIVFKVSNGSHSQGTFSRDPLEPGSEVAFNGTLVFDSSLQGMILPLYALADSCIGERDMPAYCRVDESNESNNRSDHVSVTLP